MALRSALLVESTVDEGRAARSFLESLDFDVVHLTEHAPAFDHLSRRSYDLAVIEMTGGRACDFELLQYITRNLFKTPAIATTSPANSNLGAKALQKGARSFLVKPFAEESLRQYVRQALESQRHAEQAQRLARLRQQERHGRQIVGSSPTMRSISDLISSIADSTFTTVLLKGETGTGKDLIANVIHDVTFGDAGPFNTVNCSSIPPDLLESELFGYEKGAFTSAFQTRLGIIELTEGGTLFLDDISGLPPHLQPKLLRFLDEKSFRRVGGNADIRVSLRVIASTNQSIEKLVQAGSFRRDLYFRLSGFPITLPPLRERSNDVIDLANHMIEKSARRYGKKIREISPELERLLLAYHWPGNIRELHNVIERAVIVSDGDMLKPAHFQLDPFLPVPNGSSGNHSLQAIALPLGRPLFEEVAFYEKELMERAMQEARGVKLGAARLLGISRHAFDRLAKRVCKLTGHDPASSFARIPRNDLSRIRAVEPHDGAERVQVRTRSVAK
jgi:DNA-binding NtrC family response regulator